MSKLKIQITICLLLLTTVTAEAKRESKSSDAVKSAKTTNDAVKEKSKETPYENIFKEKKNVVSAKGFMTVHKVDNKIYLEVPNEVFGRDVLLNTYVQRTSDEGVLYVGMQTAPSRRIEIDRTDSMVLLRMPTSIEIKTEDENIGKALGLSNSKPVAFAYPIIGLNSDSSAVLFECSDFFSGSNKYMVNLVGYSVGDGVVVYETNNISSSARVIDPVAYSQSVGVRHEVGIKLKLALTMIGHALSYEPEMSGELTTTLTILGDDKMKVREADSRVGTRYVPYIKFGNEGGSKNGNLVLRRSLIPIDTVQLANSGSTYPVKPVVFYVDTLFSKSWYDAIEQGINAWNAPLEAAGLSGAIKVYPYPATESFKADDPLLNTVRYNSAIATAVSTRTFTDPSTGEIIGSTIYIPRDFVAMIRKIGVNDISNVDARYRNYFIEESAVAEALRAYVMKATASLLGLSPNVAGSYAYSVKQLRDPEFTAKYGITASVTDNVLFNTVACKGDKERGVETIISKPGVYDYFAIKWLYSPVLSGNENEVLNKWILEKEYLGEYFYGKPKKSSLLDDPRSQQVGLSNDIVLSTKAAVERFKFIVEESPKWLDDDRIPELYRSLFPDFVFLRFYDYVNSHIVYLGGIYQNDLRSDSRQPSYSVVPKSEQKKVVSDVLKLCDDLSWLDNKAFVHLGGPNNNVSDLSYESMPIASLLYKIRNVAFTAEKSDDPYTVTEYLDDLSEYIFRDIRNGKELSKQHFKFASQYVAFLINKSPILSANYKANGYRPSTDIAVTEDSKMIEHLLMGVRTYQPLFDDIDCVAAGGEMEAPNGIYYYMPESVEPVIYNELQQARAMLVKGMSYCKDSFTKDKYKYYVNRIDRALKKQE